MDRVGTILPPELPSHLPSNCQWLSGQGAGVWFCLVKKTEYETYIIKRFSPEGKLDCEGEFKVENEHNDFKPNQPYQFKHISHCAECRIEQESKIYLFKCLTTL